MFLLPLLVMPLVFALLFKLAALLYGRLQVGWLHAIVFGILAMLIGGLGAFVNKAVLGGHIPALVSAVVGIVAQVALAGWYFGPRAATAGGAPAGFGRGVVLALIAFGLVFAMGLIAALVLPVLQHGGGS